MAQAMAYLTYA